MERVDAGVAQMIADEPKDIANDLVDGSHMLVLEHNPTMRAVCRALKCLVEPFHSDTKIQGPFRINLQATRLTEMNTKHWSDLDYKATKRFYHVPCFEAIGAVDLPEHLQLPKIHPAVVDWVELKGQAYQAKYYTKYDEALANWKQAQSASNVKPAATADKPKKQDFFPTKPSECLLAGVLFDTCHEAGTWMPKSEIQALQELLKADKNKKAPAAAPKSPSATTPSSDDAPAEKPSNERNGTLIAPHHLIKQ